MEEASDAELIKDLAKEADRLRAALEELLEAYEGYHGGCLHAGCTAVRAAARRVLEGKR